MRTSSFAFLVGARLNISISCSRWFLNYEREGREEGEREGEKEEGEERRKGERDREEEKKEISAST